MTREPPMIDLPQPGRERWQPLRLGLVELYHYDVEEFEFRDGHLLLRGNNGTGKSKVLSLTLPFLLDANLTAARVEPDGDRNKRMEWNLLMGGRYERRIGYTWIEFGRRGESGSPETLTLGCGLRAVAGKSGVDSWYFLTEQRIGADLWLTTAQRTALTRERLTEAIGTRGHVFQTAQDYKRAVNERLFRLGEDRYAALVNTLIQLRQPQLSKQPDEERLSNALTEALTPLDRQALEVVAEAMTQLEELRRELEELQAMRKAVAAFGDRYARYPASSGERALGLTVPLFAAASSHYWSAHPHAPRLVLLDEAFAGIDDEARANCMALIREFDLDFVMTSEREWGCYPELPGLAICQLIRREGMDAVLVTRWTWDGRERLRQEDTVRRFPPEAAESVGEPAAGRTAQLDLTS